MRCVFMVRQKIDILNKEELDQGAVIKKIELIGRNCYKSEGKITEKSAETFVKGILANNHLGLLEHVLVTSRLITTRSIANELVRHRLASYAQESTRYCNLVKRGFELIIPANFTMGECHIDLDHYPDFYKKYGLGEADVLFIESLISSCEQYETLITKYGWSMERAREVLPLGLKADIIMTTNLRELLYITNLRTTPACHPQMIELMRMLRSELHSLLPLIF